MGGWVGWLETDNRAISVQLDLTGTLTGTELGNIVIKDRVSLHQGVIFPGGVGGFPPGII